MRSLGFVWLVGAGPGDPELLTLRAARCLGEADLVLYDALVSGGVLALARGARVCVGKRAGGRGARQEAIHRLMVRAARRGLRVARLKGGDPFVLGRGGEEALALAAAGVPFEVVPGVSAALAAPALAGIPPTHRGLSSAVVVLSGHDESAFRPLLEALPVSGLTVVVLMGLRSREALARCLLVRGWSAFTPAAIVWGAATPGAATWIGRLRDLAKAPLPEGTAPATLVIGEVVSLAARVRGCGWPTGPTGMAPAAGEPSRLSEP